MKASALTKFLNLLLEESDYRKTGYFAEKLMVSNNFQLYNRAALVYERIRIGYHGKARGGYPYGG